MLFRSGDGNPRAWWDNNGKMWMYQNLGGTTDGMGIQDTGSAYGSGAVYIKFTNNAGTLAGSIQHTASTTTNYNTSSDERLKTDKGIATDISVIDNIVIHDFEWKEDGSLDKGVFAQEAYLVKPSAIAVGNTNNNIIMKQQHQTSLSSSASSPKKETQSSSSSTATTAAGGGGGEKFHHLTPYLFLRAEIGRAHV